MLNKGFLNIPENKKMVLWNKFQYEDTLLSELEFYQDRVSSMNSSQTALDIAVMTIYKNHIKNIEYFLSRLHETSQSETEQQYP